MKVITCQFQTSEYKKINQGCNEALIQIEKIKNDSHLKKLDAQKLLETVKEMESKIRAWKKNVTKLI